MDSLIHPDDRERVREALNRAASYGQQYDVEYRVVHADGREGWVSAKGRAQHDATGAMVGTYGVVQDITEKRHLEDELRRRAQELADADRKKDDFIALLAHELRNPLAPVRTGLQVMRLAADDADAVARTRNVMDRQIAHMARLIDDLLDVSRINRNKLTLRKAPIALSEIVNHAVETVRPAVDAAGHTLEVSLPSAPVVLDADLTRMAQVFGNLLTNSAKYTEPGGHIRLSAELRGGQVVVSVQDNGIGIPADSLDRVFDMFSQVDQSIGRAGGGLGIGLALVKGLVESHAGTVTVSSGGVGQGSTFIVSLPVPSHAQEVVASVGEGQKARGKWRVVIADDNQDGAKTLAMLINVLGCEAHVVNDGASAVALVERLRPDLVLMDVGMPELDGLEATRRIRAHEWAVGIRIIALTGWGQESDRQRSREAGCDGHLVKPIDLPDLEKILETLSPKDAS